MKVCEFQLMLCSYAKQIISMPKGAVLLCVDSTNGIPTLFAECPNTTPENRVIEIVLTGEELPCDMGVERKYIGSFVERNTVYPEPVYHYYERIN